MASKSFRRLFNVAKQTVNMSGPKVCSSSSIANFRSACLWAPTNHMNLTASPVKIHGCRFASSAGDAELADFLKEEIKIEQSMEKHGGKLPKIKGFEVTVNDSEITLKKEQGNKSILITLNINNSVDAKEDQAMEMEQQQEQEENQPEMVSKPPFLVEINKGGSTTLALQCAFPEPAYRDEVTGPEDEENYEDIINIEEVALLPEGKDWDESTYLLSSSVMDPQLYELMLNLLEDHGIDAEFVDQLVEFTTAYEHQKYVEFLGGLKSFAES